MSAAVRRAISPWPRAFASMVVSVVVDILACAQRRSVRAPCASTDYRVTGQIAAVTILREDDARGLEAFAVEQFRESDRDRRPATIFFEPISTSAPPSRPSLLVLRDSVQMSIRHVIAAV